MGGGDALASDYDAKAPDPTVGKDVPGDPFAADAAPNNTVLTKDGVPCTPGAGVSLEEGIAACRGVDLRDFERKDEDGEHALSWDRTYHVYNCHAAYFWGNYNMIGYSGSTTEAWDECGSTAGLRAKPAYISDWWTGQYSGAEWLMLAPPGGSVVGYNVSFWCRAYDGWAAGMLVGDSTYGIEAPPAYPGQLCWSPQGGTMPTGYYWDGYATELGGEYPGVKLSFHCRFAASCSNGQAAVAGMGSWIRNIVVTMRDTVTPTIDSGLTGTLGDGQWHGADTYPAGFTAHDGGGGIQNIRYEIDGQTIVSQDSACDYVQTAPCYEQPVYYWDNVNTATLSDGAHTLRTRARDLVGNERSFDTTIYTDKTAPAAPDNLSVTPNGWTAENGFTVSFDNPGQGGASPIDGLRYKLGEPPTGPTDGTAVDLPDGAQSGTVSDVQASEVGSTPLYVWLYDKAGNTSEVNDASGQLRFDDQAPLESKAGRANGWIGKAEADGYSQIWEVPDEPLPLSGISGYATSLDRNPIGDPGIAVTDPATPREKTLNINEEGSSYFHVRPISGAGVPGPVDTAELKVDLTDPSSELSGLPGSEWVNHDLTLSLAGSDGLSGIDPGQPGSGLWSKVDDGAFQQGPSIGLSAEGMHTITYHATDVAGNSEGDRAARVGIDKTVPTVAFANSEDPDHPAVITAIAADTPSGVADATIYYRPKGSGDPYTPIPTSLAGSTAQATFPDGDLPAGTYQLKVVARDKAANEASSTSRQNGQAMLLDAPLRDATKVDAGFATKATKQKTRCSKKSRRTERGKRKKVRRCKSAAPVLTGLATGVKVAYGKNATVKGVIYDSAEHPIKYAPLAVYLKQDIPGADWQRVDRTMADDQGAFAVTVAKGYSRIVRIRYEGTELRRSAESKDLQLKVKARVSLLVRPKRLRNGRLMRFKGKIKTHPGAHLPPGGKLVALEFLDRRGGKRSWKVAGKVLRTNAKGVIKGGYRFRHVSYRQRIVFALDVLREETFPYIPGRSRSRSVTVRP